jgi:hypothetical protein
VAFADDHGAGLFRRVVGFFRSVPEATAANETGSTAPVPLAAPPAPPTAPWIVRRREGERAFDEGKFTVAARLLEEAAAITGVPSRDVALLRARAGRSRIFDLLAPWNEGAPDTSAEPEMRRLVDAAATANTSGAWLGAVRFALSKNLRHHLPFALERALARRNDGTREFDAAVATAYRAMRSTLGAPPLQVAEAVERELPIGEAADLAREDTGGIGGARLRGEGGATDDAERDALIERARALKSEGDVEYRLAVPGSEKVNDHRRAALNAYTESRRIYEDLQRGAAGGVYNKVIHDLNRNIAELKKDLPVGK